MSKRGQITVFILIGITLLIIFGIVFYTKGNVSKKETETAAKKINADAFDIIPVRKYVESCLKKASDDGLWLLGAQGGYVELPEGLSSTFYEDNLVPYYLSGTTPTYPSIDNMESGLSKYVIVEFQKCLDLSTFDYIGFNITGPEVDTTTGYAKIELVGINVSINKDDVVVSVEYPLTISKKDSEIKAKDFRVVLPVRLGRLYNVSVNKDMVGQNGVMIDIKNAWGIPEEYNLDNLNCDYYDPLLKQITVVSTSNDAGEVNTKIIKLIDYNSFYHNYFYSYTFQFAIQKNPIYFSGGECTGTLLP